VKKRKVAGGHLQLGIGGGKKRGENFSKWLGKGKKYLLRGS